MGDICAEMEQFGKGIGNASRYRIVRALLRGPKTVGELIPVARLSQPAVSQHLKTLAACGLVVGTRHGQEVLYSVNTSHLLRLLTTLSNQVEKQKKGAGKKLQRS